MNTFFRSSVVVLLFSSVFLFSSCEDDPELPENIVQFEASEQGIATNEQELIVHFTFTRPVDVQGSFVLLMNPIGVTLGTDFTTEPAATGLTISFPVQVGDTGASLKIIKTPGVLLDGDEKIGIIIQSSTSALTIGEKSELTISFGEILSNMGTIELNGGGPTFPNKVFIDLSANRQTAVARTSWDLGFSSGDDFRVILNSSNGMMARAINKTSLAEVTAADTLNFGKQLSYAAVFAAVTSDEAAPAWLPEAITWIDDPTGDMTKTAISAISSTEFENKVYIVNRGTGPSNTELGWKKIRIIRNGSNYTLQQADIASATFTEVQVTKDSNLRFQYVSFGSGVVSVEPAKDKWDIAWTAFGNTTDFGSGLVPYYFQDIVLQNTAVQTVRVMNSVIAYDAFTTSDISTLTFGTSQINIGADWRSGGGPGVSPAVRSDRYYVIKDPDGNYYKLKFTALTTNAERGKPKFEFALVSAAN